jgi:hypothetical protein
VSILDELTLFERFKIASALEVRHGMEYWAQIGAFTDRERDRQTDRQMKGATERGGGGGARAWGGRQRQRQAKTDRDRRRYGDREADMSTHTVAE